MVALAVERDTEKMVGDPISPRFSLGVAVDIIFKGAMVAKNAAGFLAPAGIASTDVVIGRALATYDNSGGTAGDIVGEAEQGIFRWANGETLDDTDIGAVCYASDDQTVVTTAGTNPKAGIVVAVDAVGVWVMQGLFLATP